MNNKLSAQFTVPSLLQFALPTIIMMVFMSIYTMVDGIFVSRLISTSALSAVNIVFPLLSVVIALGIMLGTGGSAIVARKMGEGKPEEARQDFTLIVLAGVVLGLLYMAAILLFQEPILRFLGANDAIYDLCRDYARPLLWFTVPGILQMMFQTFFVTAGFPAVGLVLTVLGGVAHMVLDYVFIAVFDWGIAGASIAAGVGFSIPGLFGLLWFLSRRRDILCFERPAWRGKILLEACFNGSSEMVTNLSTAVITFLFNLFMMRYLGEDGVAAISIILYAEYLLTAIFLGYSSGIAPVVSYNHGEGNTPQLKRLFRISIGFLLITSVATLATSLLLARQIVGIFTAPGTHVFVLALHGFYLYSVCFLFKGINIYASSLFTALSDGKTSAILSFLRTLVFIILGMLLLPLFLEVDGIYLAVPLAEILGLITSLYCFKKLFSGRWKKEKPEKVENASPKPEGKARNSPHLTQTKPDRRTT